jgi:hypothetical protein
MTPRMTEDYPLSITTGTVALHLQFSEMVLLPHGGAPKQVSAPN